MKLSTFRSIAQSLPWLVLLCTGCSTYDASQSPSPGALQPSAQLNNKSAGLESHEMKELFAYLEAIMRNVIEYKDDPSIEITRMQKDGCMDTSLSDPQVTPACMILTFKDFPGKPPYNIHWRRLLQEDPNAFLPRPFDAALLNAVHDQNETIPFSFAIQPHEFLPGERVTWRLSSADGKAVKEAMVCPRPMIIKDESGNTVFEAALLTIHTPCLSYLIHIPARDEMAEFISTSEEEIIKETIFLKHSANITYMPAVKGKEGGISEIEIRFLKDGSSYKMQFPWGTALSDCIEARTL